jgi:hypothetical protein
MRMANKQVQFKVTVLCGPQHNRQRRTEIVKSTNALSASRRVRDQYQWSSHIWPNGKEMTFEQHLKIELADHAKLGITVKIVEAEVVSVERL